MGLLFFYLFLALCVSFLCSLLEATLLSVPRAYIEVMEKEGKKGGRILRRLREEVDRPLAAILTLNTIANTMGAAGVGAQVHAVFGEAWVTTGAVLLTLLILIGSEILPKTLGAVYARGLADFTAHACRVLIVLAYPFVLLSEGFGRLLAGRGDALAISREELIASAELGVREGVLAAREGRVVRNLLSLEDVRVADVMTPRSVVFALAKDKTVKEVCDEHPFPYYSRIPIYEKDLDDARFFVHRYRIMRAAAEDRHETRLADLAEPLPRIEQEASVAQALDVFLRERVHILLVTDDGDRPVGLVTLEDAVETLLGVEIVDEFDSVADLRQYAAELLRKRQWGRYGRGGLDSVDSPTIA